MPETSTALALVETGEEVDYADCSLPDLARLVDTGHLRVTEHVASTLKYAIATGRILLEVRSRLTGGEWIGWVEANTGVGRRAASRYIRLALYSDSIEDAQTINSAIAAISHMPHRSRAANTYDEFCRTEARQMRDIGMSYRDIAADLDVPRGTVYRWLNSDANRRYNRQKAQRQARERAARKALAEKERREERNALAKAAGGIVEKSYTDVRTLCATLDAALAQAEPAQRESLREALRHAHKAEDAIVDALKAAR